MKYESVYVMLRDVAPGFCDGLSLEHRDFLSHVDDFEPYEFSVLRGVVTMKDSISGDVLLMQPMSDFLRDTLAFLREEVSV